MFASVLSASILGMEVCPIQVEADVSDGLPSFTMVGYPSAQVKEAQDRVRTALRNNGISLPPKRVTVNFVPADIKKEGAGFDIPVAAAVLSAAGILHPSLLEGVMLAGGDQPERRDLSCAGYSCQSDQSKGIKVQILYGSLW